MTVPDAGDVAVGLLRLVVDQPDHGLTPGVEVDIAVVPEGLPIYTDKKLSVVAYGPTLDKVLRATGHVRYEVTCNDKPLGYCIMRPGIEHPSEYGTSLSAEILRHRNDFPGEVRLCLCIPVVQALWWPEVKRVQALHTIGYEAQGWVDQLMTEEEFHARLCGVNLNLAVDWTLADSGIDDALDVIIGVVDEWVDEGRFEAIRHALASAKAFYLASATDVALHPSPAGSPAYVEDVTLALGWLTATARARGTLGAARADYFRRVDAYLRGRAHPDREALLAGLG